MTTWLTVIDAAEDSGLTGDTISTACERREAPARACRWAPHDPPESRVDRRVARAARARYTQSAYGGAHVAAQRRIVARPERRTRRGTVQDLRAQRPCSRPMRARVVGAIPPRARQPREMGESRDQNQDRRGPSL